LLIGELVMEPEKNLENQIPLILFRLDTTAQVLEEIKSVLDKQTQNLSSLLVLQEKYNNLHAQVSSIQNNFAKELDDLKKDTTKEIETLKTDLDKANKEIDKQNGFVEKFNGGMYVGLFLFAIFQSIVVWWINDYGDQVKKARDSIEGVANRVIVLETQKQQR